MGTLFHVQLLLIGRHVVSVLTSPYLQIQDTGLAELVCQVLHHHIVCDRGRGEEEGGGGGREGGREGGRGRGELMERNETEGVVS